MSNNPIKEIKLLNHQYEVLADTTTRILGMVAGYGSGKTYTACRKAIQLSFLNEGCTGIVTEPTFPMLRDIFIPEMKTALEEWGIKYKFNASSSIFTFNVRGKENKILCMSMENVERLVGINAAFIICDEFDTSKADLAYKAFIKLLGRLRAGIVRQFVIVTTPEGFKATYKIFIEEKADNKRLIKARTKDNKYLPADFIDTLKQQYPEALLKAYLNGEFVNLSQGTVYSSFNREQHHSDREVEPYDKLLIGQDFNVGGCVSIVYVETGMGLIAVDEYESVDTQRIIDNTRHKYPDHHITFSPDSSGYANKTNASRSDIQMILDAGFEVDAPSQNGRVMDRVNATNNAFEKGLLYINTNKCPKFTKALEQQAWTDKGEPEKFNGAATIDDYNDAGTYPVVRKLGLTRPKISHYEGSFL